VLGVRGHVGGMGLQAQLSMGRAAAAAGPAGRPGRSGLIRGGQGDCQAERQADRRS